MHYQIWTEMSTRGLSTLKYSWWLKWDCIFKIFNPLPVYDSWWNFAAFDMIASHDLNRRSGTDIQTVLSLGLFYLHTRMLVSHLPCSLAFFWQVFMLLSKDEKHESPLKIVTTCWHVLWSLQKTLVAYQLEIIILIGSFQPYSYQITDQI